MMMMVDDDGGESSDGGDYIEDGRNASTEKYYSNRFSKNGSADHEAFEGSALVFQ